MMLTSEEKATQLIAYLRPLRRVIIAFSGGVDSSVVAAAAMRAELEQAIAVTGDSASVPQWQLDWAKRIALQIGIEHRVIATQEGRLEEYVRNDSQRCFFCKQTLYGTLDEIAAEHHGSVIVSGTNADDLGDYRPGIDAGRRANIQTPLADLGMTKSDVRQLAQWFGLDNADLPASPCLASRVAYGVEVTAERLQRIERAESWLRQQHFSDLRVRVHHDELARVEVPRDEMVRFLDETLLRGMEIAFRELGFHFVTLDLRGLQSGSMNRSLVSIGLAQPEK